MGQAEYDSSFWEEYKGLHSSLKESLNSLAEASRQHLKQQYGLSESFKLLVNSESDAMELCTKAMQTLAKDYVSSLQDVLDEQDPVQCIHALDRTEAIWRAESVVISGFDKDGTEKQFLKQMREQTLMILNRRLGDAAEICSTRATPENMALVIGVMAVMDYIHGELGEPVDAPARQALRAQALAFK